MSAYESIKRGLTEAMVFAEGRKTSARVHQMEVPLVDVAAIRCCANRPILKKDAPSV
jgi:putative transcriptional regulator